MNIVAPCVAGQPPAARPATSAGTREPGPRRPRVDRTGGRGRSVGSSSAGSAGEPVPPVGQLPRPAPRRPASGRCQTAKSAYCTGSGGSGSGAPAGTPRTALAARAAGRRPTSRRRRRGAWSATSTCSLGRSRSQRTPGAAARPPGRTAPPRPSATSRSRGGHRAGQARTGPRPAAVDRRRRVDHLMGDRRPRPRPAGSAAPRAAPPPRPAPRRSAADVERRRPAAPASARCTRPTPGSSWSRNHSRCCANDSGSGPVPGHRRRSAARSSPRRRAVDHRGQAGARVGLVEQRRAAAARRRTPPGPARPPGWPAASARPARRSRRAAPTRSTPSTSAQIPASTSSAGVARRHVRRPARAGRVRRRQRRPVDLAVRRSAAARPARRTPPAPCTPAAGRRERRAARRPPGRPGRGRRAPGRPTSRAPSSRRGHHRRRATAGMGGQHRLDLARLDPEPAHLDLVVDPAQELQLPVRPPPRQVAGPVQPRAVGRERIGHEPLRGQLRPARGSRGPARRPPMNSSPATPTGTGLQGPVQHVQPGVGDRRARSAAPPAAPGRTGRWSTHRPSPRSARTR